MPIAEMTTAEKEKRILEQGRPWVDLMKGLEFHPHATAEERSDRNADAVSRAREDYYSNALIVILECVERVKSIKFA